MYVGFMDMEEVYDRVYRQVLWDIQNMYDENDKLLNFI